jgi:hypothetical protein
MCMNPPNAGSYREYQDLINMAYYINWEVTGRGNRIRADFLAADSFATTVMGPEEY